MSRDKQHGYMGRLLFVDLTAGAVSDEVLDRKNDAEHFLGGPGLGAKILYERMPAHTDAFDEKSMIGFISGPLNNTMSLFSGRYTVVCKSPVTGGWNDANSGGFFGKRLKRSGYDAIYVHGIAKKPVYLFVDNGTATILDATELWGLTTKAAEDKLAAKHGKDISIALIGPAGENLSYISAVMSDAHRAAARGGCGAVMGSKKLKAVVVKGKQKTPVAHPVKAFFINVEMTFFLLKGLFTQKEYRDFRKYGTGGTYKDSVCAGDAGLKNWSGSLSEYTESDADQLSSQGIHRYKTGTYCCAQCFIGCSVHMKVGTNRWGTLKTTRPEYETMGAFGSLLLNKDVESVIMANELCNEYGFDTISAGSTIAWAMECYENGLFTEDELGGAQLSWGNGDAVVSLLRLMGQSEGIGAVLAKGSQKASEILGKGAEFLVTASGIEIPQHDPRFLYGLGRTYMADPTPGRHVKASVNGLTGDEGFEPDLTFRGTGPEEAIAVMNTEIMNACGACAFGYSYGNPNHAIFRLINAVTGFDYTPEQTLLLGLRIFAIRQAFNLREGLERKTATMSERLKWLKATPDEPADNSRTDSPQTDSPKADSPKDKADHAKYMDFDIMVDTLYHTLGWDKNGIPSEGTLTRLGGMDSVIRDLYHPAVTKTAEENQANAHPSPYFTGRRPRQKK